MKKSVLLLAIAAPLLVGVLATTDYVSAAGKGVDSCDGIADTNCKLNFTWDPDERSTDPNNLILITGSLRSIGLSNDQTTDVNGELEGMLVGATKKTSSKTVTSSSGSTTITTTIESASRATNNFAGTITIEGVPYRAQLKTTGYDATQLEVFQEVVTSTGEREGEITRLLIFGTLTMCNPDNECLQGFATLKKQFSGNKSSKGQISLSSESLEAEVIGEDGLFDLNLRKIQRQVAT